MREVRRTNRGARSGGDKSAVSTWATLSIGVVVGAVGFYADVFSKVHTAACKGLPIIGIAVGWLNCSDIDSEAIAKIDRGVKQVEQGVGRLEYGVGAIRSAVKETDARTQGIAEDIKAIQKGADPTTLARQRILASPYLPDNHGYIKAIAHGSPLIDQFDVLGIRGDETALRQEILGSPISSNEFRNLGLFLQKAPVGHYAAKVREEFAAFFAELQVTNSANALRAATCSTGP